jgi:hypothetical protein
MPVQRKQLSDVGSHIGEKRVAGDAHRPMDCQPFLRGRQGNLFGCGSTQRFSDWRHGHPNPHEDGQRLAPCAVHRAAADDAVSAAIAALGARHAGRSSADMIAAQPGPQTEFLRSSADIVIYGGAAGGGKTAGLILEPLRHVGRIANFTAVFFRRTMPQITNPGALWDESLNFYPRLCGTPHLRMREWRWPRGGRIKFAHL